MKTEQKLIKQNLQRTAEFDTETKELISNLLSSYLRKFGSNLVDIKANYRASKEGIFNENPSKFSKTPGIPKRYSVDTLYNFANGHSVEKRTAFDVMKHFNLKFDEKFFQNEGIIKHVGNEK